ncbi:SDR family oxidoreductase [Mesorhizobium sp. M00.F.Ca.ET.216.01.1.1]|uniref:SDR family oxidoreductase n=1 Tax=Mesorhizobium sp. M00.F.Ca.ET.216.01.1.1 TaxID=2500528 RepID=UPI000FD8620E|nr:SDR family oxidoreductase [Mesorhizobium sp. M00.F.Ca.ET.216.01.1.1]TGQ35655.1 SDR family oxidoreductase [Mesorhizobium sp. M00.F.Ca.ET.216.01.1.1]
MDDISDKVVLISGASSGIGEATARELAAAGAKVMIGARRVERLEALARELGDNVGWARLDVTEREGFAAFAAAAEERFGRIDVLVNNAGVMPLSPLAALLVEQWDWMIDVNIRGVLNGIAAVLPHFQARGSGQIVNVASIAAHRVVPAAAVYCATKYAVWAITDGIRQEHRNIRATIISPGATESELADTITDPMTQERVAAFRAAGMVGADAVARAIRFAIGQPADVDVSEVVVNPTVSM